VSHRWHSPGKSHLSLPLGFQAALGGQPNIDQILDTHWQTVHEWFPIGKLPTNALLACADLLAKVSRLRLDRHLGRPVLDGDVLLVLLSMKLLQQPLIDSDYSETASLYQLCKSGYAYLESRNDLSVHLLQAALFIGLYEIGSVRRPPKSQDDVLKQFVFHVANPPCRPSIPPHSKSCVANAMLFTSGF
jgi:hypothetical protein